jgi:hypothetical protein
MKIKYLNTVEHGARWFRSYYRRNPQLDVKRAIESLKAAERTLSDFPLSAERFEDRDDVREQQVLGTPFSLLYTIARDTIWIIDIRDTRGLRSAEALRAFTKELRERYGINSNPIDS